MAETFDIIIIGSGINSLVCAAELALRGRRVLVLERSNMLGGCMVTEEATLPGYRHDLFAMSLPLFVTAPYYSRLGPALAEEGMQLITGAKPTAVVLPDGRSLVFTQSREANVAALEALSPGDGLAYRAAMKEIEENAGIIFGLLGQEPRSRATLKILAQAYWRNRADGLAVLAGDALQPMRHWLTGAFGSELSRALIAPWILHTGLDPEAPLSALMGKLILFTLEAAGIPFVEGGISNLVQAFARLIERHGGQLRTGCDVERILVSGNKAVGVSSADGSAFHARRAIVCNVTPGQLYGRLLPHDNRPALPLRHRAGRSDMQIHIALAAPPQWADPALNGVALLHLTPGLDGVSRAVNEAVRGLLPAEGTIVVGQPAETDPTRCPPGRSLLWVQLQELPAKPKGDAAGVIPVRDGEGWSEALKALYAERIVERLSRHIVNLDEINRGMCVLSPTDLENRNMNLEDGDPYSGDCAIDQFHLFRPFAGAKNHGTSVRNLYHIGASTHPGPGLGGMSGYLVARAL